MLCVLILYIIGGNYSLKSTPNDRFYEKPIMAILFTLRFLLEICREGNVEEVLFVFLFCCLAWDSNSCFTSNKPVKYLLDYGDFILDYIPITYHLLWHHFSSNLCICFDQNNIVLRLTSRHKFADIEVIRHLFKGDSAIPSTISLEEN